MKVLMVCLGNICRSPVAEGILKDKIKDKNLNIEVDSAGTSDYHIDQSPDERAVGNCNSHGIDISNLRGRQLIVEDFDIYDKIFVMDTSNYQNTIALARNASDKAKVQMILNLSQPNSDMSVPDPYFGGEDGFENVYQLLDAACNVFLEELEQ